MTECTGEEICEEWLYHMGVPTDKIEALAKSHANTVPVMMPYITAFSCRVRPVIGRTWCRMAL